MRKQTLLMRAMSRYHKLRRYYWSKALEHDGASTDDKFAGFVFSNDNPFAWKYDKAFRKYAEYHAKIFCADGSIF